MTLSKNTNLKGFVSQKKEVLGSIIEIQLLKHNSVLIPICFSELDRIEKTYSRFLKDSVLSKANKQLCTWQTVPPEFIFLVQQACALKKETKGNFDITLKSTLDALGYDNEYSFQPKKQTNRTFFSLIRNALFPPISIDTSHQSIILRKEIEFGGFGKGSTSGSTYHKSGLKKRSDYGSNSYGD